MNVKYIMLPIFAAIMVCGLGTAHAENYIVEMTKNGFSTNEISIVAGDSVTFVNKHYVTAINVEPHAISDPFAVPYTNYSYWIIDDSKLSHTFNFKTCDSEINYVFHDRFFTVYPIFIKCGNQQVSATITPEIVPKPVIINSVPKVNTILDASEQELTSKLTNSLEREGILKNEVIKLKDEISVLNHKASQINQYITTLQSDNTSLINDKVLLQDELVTVSEERDYFEKQWQSWKGIAMEQLKVMVNILGIKN